MADSSAVNTYLHNELKPLLISFNVSHEFIEEIIESIGVQIASFVSHWDDAEFCNGLSVIGLEEGIFYKPYANINSFVAVAIRNSLIESLNSCEYSRTGLLQPLSDEKMKAITKQAIL